MVQELTAYRRAYVTFEAAVPRDEYVRALARALEWRHGPDVHLSLWDRDGDVLVTEYGSVPAGDPETIRLLAWVRTSKARLAGPVRVHWRDFGVLEWYEAGEE